MNLPVLLPWLACVALLTVRLLLAVALSPALSAYGVPAMVRSALVVVLAAITFADRSVPLAASAWVADPLLLAVACGAEVFIGALLGLGLHVVLGAFALAGKLLDVQVGIGIGSVFDPVTRTNANVIGALVGLLGGTLFFVTDAHLALVQLIARSIDLMPLGELPVFDDPMQLLAATGAMFVLGLIMVAPVATALLLIDVVVGVVSRNMPQINVLVLAVPIKVVVGYLVLAAAVLGWGQWVQQGFAGMNAILELR